jgi:hypothetical protein
MASDIVPTSRGPLRVCTISGFVFSIALLLRNGSSRVDILPLLYVFQKHHFQAKRNPARGRVSVGKK